jgi:UDP-N-acetylmuramate: L-alanyl-gamma-D-glutamyl-meso-diaminopimelate ligase
MASLAGMLQTRGYKITGSDAAAYPPMSDVLAGLGIALHQPYAEANLTPRPDLVIVGNAISRGNVELEYVLDTRIPFTSMAAVLHDEFLPGREPLVVAGTHGKTTTTSMLAWIYETASKGNREQGAGNREQRGSGVCAFIFDWRGCGKLWDQFYGARHAAVHSGRR